MRKLWIKANVPVLLQHWHGEIDSVKLLDVLPPPGSDYNTEEIQQHTEE